MTCLHCPNKLCRDNVTGVCRSCFPKHGISRLRQLDPDYDKKRSAKIRYNYQVNPQRRAQIAARVREYCKRPEVRKAKSERAKAIGLSAMGIAAQPAGSESRVRGGRNVTATKLAWCPHELRDEYKRLIRKKGFTAKEAKAVILATDKARLERIHGAAK